MRSFAGRLVLFFGVLLLVLSGCQVSEQPEEKPDVQVKKQKSDIHKEKQTEEIPAHKEQEQQKQKEKPTAQAPTPKSPPKSEPSNVVAKIGDYVITIEELEKRLMSELRPDAYQQYNIEEKPADTKTDFGELSRAVLLEMIAEKAMTMEARKLGYLKDEQIQTSIKRFSEKMLNNMCLGKYFQGKKNEMAVTDAEIKEKLKTNPKLDKKRATALLQREKGTKIFEQYYAQLCEKFNVQKISTNFPKAAEIHQRLLNNPKEPRKMWWIDGRQIREELTPEEKNIVLATYGNEKVTLEDWFNALSEIVPPGRPKNLNTPEGVEQLLERPLKMGVVVAEAEALGLDKDKNYLKQLRLREDSMLLGKATTEPLKHIKDPNDQQIVAYFNKNKQAFAIPDTLKIDQIWCKDRDTALKVKEELNAGKDFNSVKKEHSLQKKGNAFDTTAGSEGMFFKDLWKGDPNEIIGPAKGFYGNEIKWRIVRILEKKPAQFKEYTSDMNNNIKYRMMDDQRKKILANYRIELLEKYSYEIYTERIKNINPLHIP